MIRLTALLFALGMIAAWASESQAQDLAVGGQIRLVGKGVRHKKEPRSLALSCDIQTCTRYQWIYFRDVQHCRHGWIYGGFACNRCDQAIPL